MSEYKQYHGIFCGKYFDVRKKEDNAKRHVMYMLMRTAGMFKYTGLPDTIPEHIIETYLQVHGHACITKVNDDLYCFTGGLGGELNQNYEPTIYTVANPYLNFSKNLSIGTDCALLKNDDYYIGLLPMYNYYASMLSDNELSLYLGMVNSRIMALISAKDNATVASGERYLKKIESGDMGIIMDDAFIDGIRVQPYGSANTTLTVKNLIENEQYLKASWFNELGLDANYNMKRETLTDSENEMNKDSLLPLVDRMLYVRKQCMENVNNLYGTNITVDFSGQWKAKAEEEEIMHEIMESQVNDDPEREVNDDTEQAN